MITTLGKGAGDYVYVGDTNGTQTIKGSVITNLGSGASDYIYVGFMVGTQTINGSVITLLGGGSSDQFFLGGFSDATEVVHGSVSTILGGGDHDSVTIGEAVAETISGSLTISDLGLRGTSGSNPSTSILISTGRACGCTRASRKYWSVVDPTQYAPLPGAGRPAVTATVPEFPGDRLDIANSAGCAPTAPWKTTTLRNPLRSILARSATQFSGIRFDSDDVCTGYRGHRAGVPAEIGADIDE